MRAKIYIVICAALISLAMPGETGEIRGIVYSENLNDMVPYATVEAYSDTTLITATTSDIDGKYVLKSLAPGVYKLRIASVGYQTTFFNNAKVDAGKICFVDVKILKGLELKSVTISNYKIPLKDKSTSNNTISYEDIQAAPTRSVNSMQSTVSGVFNFQEEVDYRGSRNDAATHYVDAVKVRGNRNKPVENTEEYEKIYENSFLSVLHNPLSTFSIDVDAASYSNIRRFINQGSLPPRDAVRIEEMINYFSYNYPQPTDDAPFSITTEVSACPWNMKHKLIHIGLDGKKIPTENLPESNLVFLIDVSGSMDEPDKLPLLKKSFHLLVEQLRKQDRVAIVVYAGNAGLVLNSTPGDQKEKILSAIDGLEAGGSTAGGEGIKLAYKIAKENLLREGNNRVILATDGDFNVGVSSDGDLISLIEKKRDEGIFLTVLGFGTGNYKDSKMEKLADKGNGNFAYVDNIMEANKVFVKEMGATLNTIAKDVKLQIEFNPAKVKGYRLIGYENRLLNDQDFNDDKKDAGELGSGSSVTAFYEIIPVGSDEKVNDIDSLKYQSTQTVKSAGDELMTVKFRYKDPNGSKSKLIVHPLIDGQTALANTTNDFRFAAAVAEFGMLLRGSEFKGNADYKSILALARESKGVDMEGYRSEFIHLVEAAELLQKETARSTRGAK